jgi:hypothetical protein
MLWPGHVYMTRMIFGQLSWSDIVWSIAPDLPMLTMLFWPHTWSTMKQWTLYSLTYNLPHSFLFLILIQNSKAQKIYGFHIFLDLMSHTGQWSIQPFWPFGPSVQGFMNSVDWH